MEVTRDLLDSLRRARGFNSSFQLLHLAGGSSPTRPPPSDASISELRRKFSRCLPGDLPVDADMRHPASPWRWSLFDALATMTDDPDRAVARWLKDGAPMGLSEAITPGGHFPRLTTPPETAPGELSRCRVGTSTTLVFERSFQATPKLQD